MSDKIPFAISLLPFHFELTSFYKRFVTHRDGKFLKTSLALTAEIFENLDAKIEEIMKKNLKISLTLHEHLLANASRRVEFYTPESHVNKQEVSEMFWDKPIFATQ